MLSDQPRTCVVVSYWTGRPPAPLYRLLGQMKRVKAGSPFDLVVVCNGGDVAPLTLPARFAALGPRVFQRENTGWNLGAWDHGWRSAGVYDHFLFLQDDCLIKAPNWVHDFEYRVENDPGIGLLGEMVMWDKQTWTYVRTATDHYLGRGGWPVDEPDHPLDTYQRAMRERGIDPGVLGTHLPSIVLFSSRRVLEAVGGFPLFGSTYRQAVTSEIAISRIIEAHGYRISMVTNHPFSRIGHPQWSEPLPLRARAKALLKRLGVRKPGKWGAGSGE